MRIVRILGVVVGVLVLATVGRVLWVRYSYDLSRDLHKEVISSSAGRWLRCRGATRPILSAANSSWRLRYEWADGIGPGSVSVEIDSTGAATVSSTANGQTITQVTRHHLTEQDVRELAQSVDRSGLLCQAPILRVGYRVFDIGRSTIEVVTGKGITREYIDECNTLPDVYAFGEVSKVISSFKPRLRPEIDWGPYGAASGSGSCSKQ